MYTTVESARWESRCGSDAGGALSLARISTFVFFSLLKIIFSVEENLNNNLLTEILHVFLMEIKKIYFFKFLVVDFN